MSDWKWLDEIETQIKTSTDLHEGAEFEEEWVSALDVRNMIASIREMKKALGKLAQYPCTNIEKYQPHSFCTHGIASEALAKCAEGFFNE